MRAWGEKKGMDRQKLYHDVFVIIVCIPEQAAQNGENNKSRQPCLAPGPYTQIDSGRMAMHTLPGTACA